MMKLALTVLRYLFIVHFQILISSAFIMTQKFEHSDSCEVMIQNLDPIEGYILLV